ncbi:MAG: twin-arginine translocation signal domain-containing protein [Chloroflexi bacterium]|nr:MAG: twin-arginine translocation signal domain-containing protein [Chloroflexota bacterium]
MQGRLTRRAFLRTGATAAATAAVGLAAAPEPAGAAAFQDPGPHDLVEVTIAELQARMRAGRLTAVELVDEYLRRIEAIDRGGPALRSVLEVNPDARPIAAALDRERRQRGPRGPLHGIPLVVNKGHQPSAATERRLTVKATIELEGGRRGRAR